MAMTSLLIIIALFFLASFSNSLIHQQPTSDSLRVQPLYACLLVHSHIIIHQYIFSIAVLLIQFCWCRIRNWWRRRK